MEVKKVAVFAGTFDPITLGHLDLINRSLEMFDEIIVLIAVNPNKHPYFDLKTRLKFINEVIKDCPNVTVDYTDGFTIDYANKHHAQYLIRGTRNDNDTKYEEELKKANLKLSSKIKTIILKANPIYQDISSSLVIEKIKKGEDVSSYIPKGIISYLS